MQGCRIVLLCVQLCLAVIHTIPICVFSKVMEQGQKDLLDTEFLNFRYCYTSGYCLNVTIFKYLIPINQLPDLGY